MSKELVINYQQENGEYVEKIFSKEEFEKAKELYEKLLWFNSLFPQESAITHNTAIYLDQIKHLDEVWDWLEKGVKEYEKKGYKTNKCRY